MFTVRINTAEAQARGQRFISQLSDACQRGNRKVVEDGFNDSQRLVHVITGRLKRSGNIKEVTPDRASYGYDAPYAGDEENGTSRRPAHPFVRPRYQILNNGLAADYIFQEIRGINF